MNHNISIFESFGELSLSNIPSFAEPIVKDLFDESSQILSKTLHTVREIQNTDFHCYKEHFARKLRNEKLLNVRLELHSVLKKFMDKSKENGKRIQDRIISYSQPHFDNEPTKQISLEMRFQEIRSLLRPKSLTEIKQILSDTISNGKPDFLYAVSTSPDSIIPKGTLYDFQRQWAFSQNPDLQNYEFQCEQLQQITRKKCAELNSSQSVILLKNEMQDPVTKKLHFQTFLPRDEHEQEIADSLIESENRLQRQIEAKQEFDEQNIGLNL
jgi:hypothetical protein